MSASAVLWWKSARCRATFRCSPLELRDRLPAPGAALLPAGDPALRPPERRLRLAVRPQRGDRLPLAGGQEAGQPHVDPHGGQGAGEHVRLALVADDDARASRPPCG